MTHIQDPVCEVDTDRGQVLRKAAGLVKTLVVSLTRANFSPGARGL